MAILRTCAKLSLVVFACASDATEDSQAAPITPPTDGFFFASTFSFGETAWSLSSHPDYEGQKVEVLRDGDLEPPFDNDMALMLMEDAKKYGVASVFKTPLLAHGKTLVLQYEVKLNKGLSCGGAYLKLLQDPYHEDKAEPESLEAFSGATPYTIMFGPDHCGQATNKVHFIYQHKNPVTGKYEEHHAKDVPAAHTDTGSHLYTLVVRPDESFEILVDLESKLNGSLATPYDVPTEVVDPDAKKPDDWDEDEDGDWEPPVVPNPAYHPPSLEPRIGGEAEIDDPTDLKPSDWVDESHIPDPTATKPEDWDEDEPPMIDDPNEFMPSDWLPDEPWKIKDPDAKEPEDWDEDEDGAWEAPIIANPKCSEGKCGVWENPKMHNPKYKGKWFPPMVDNPAFKGVWAPRRMPNPEHFVDLAPSRSMAPIAAVAVEVWTMQGGVRFDNVILCVECEAEAKAFAEATWRLKLPMEQRARAADVEAKRKSDIEAKRAEGGVQNIIEVAAYDLIEFTKANKLACLATFLAVLAALVFWCARPDYDAALGRNGTKPPVFPANPTKAAAPSPPAAASSSEKDEGNADEAGDDDEADETDENALSAAAGAALESPVKGPAKRKTKKSPRATDE